jgi:hypothetical protein
VRYHQNPRSTDRGTHPWPPDRPLTGSTIVVPHT